jgi:hypothetical protein
MPLHLTETQNNVRHLSQDLKETAARELVMKQSKQATNKLEAQLSFTSQTICTALLVLEMSSLKCW